MSFGGVLGVFVVGCVLGGLEGWWVLLLWF